MHRDRIESPEAPEYGRGLAVREKSFACQVRASLFLTSLFIELAVDRNRRTRAYLASTIGRAPGQFRR
jgi:hypothetical protein